MKMENIFEIRLQIRIMREFGICLSEIMQDLLVFHVEDCETLHVHVSIILTLQCLTGFAQHIQKADTMPVFMSSLPPHKLR